MKKVFIILLVAVAGIACNESSSSVYYNKESKKADPAVLIAKNEFRKIYNKVSDHFENTLFKRGFSGQVLIAQNGKIIFDKVSGYSNFSAKDSLTFESPMHLASASKPFTATAVLYLAEKGMLRLDDSITKFFPDFPYESITVSMLLSHRSGLPNYLYYLSAINKQDTCYTNEDVLNSFYVLKPSLDRLPGKRFGYSNTNYVLLALIIEKVTGKSYPDFFRETFAEPLGMTNTFVLTSENAYRATPTYNGYGRVWSADQFDCTYGDKNLYSTTEDMYKWAQALDSGKIISRKMMDSAFTPLSNERPSLHNYGLGWRLLDFKDGKKIIYHNGRWHGTNSAFAWLPEENVTILIIGNKYNRNIYSSAKKAYDLFGNYFTESDPADDMSDPDLEDNP